MDKTKKHICLVDGSSYIFRAYHALPPLTRKSDGFPVGAISGFCNMLDKLVKEEKEKKEAKKAKGTYVISIKTHSYQWLEGSAYWESPTLELPKTKENKEALKLHLEGKSKQRQGV